MARRLLVALALVTAGPLGLGLLAPAQADVGAAGKTSVRATVDQDPETGALTGRVISTRPLCRVGRLVTAVFRRDGEWQAEAIAETENNGTWRTEDSAGLSGARGLRVYLPSSATCRRAESRVIDVAGDAAATKRANVKAALRVPPESTTPEGRLTSKRASCAARRPVVVFLRTVSAQRPFVATFVKETDARGRWSLTAEETGQLWDDGGRRVTLLAYTPSSGSCQVAQSSRVDVFAS